MNTKKMMTISLPAALAAALSIALAAAAGSASAQQKNDLLSIYRDAVSFDPVFASARFAREAAQERTPQARGALLPNVSAGLGVSETNFHNSSPEFSRTFSSWGPSLTATLPLYRPQLWNQLDQAKLTVEQSEAQFALARNDLVLRVTQAYFDVLAAQDALTAIEASKKGVAEQLAQAKREFEVGTKTIVDTHEAQARYDQIVAQEQVARGDLIVKQSALRVIIGRDAGTLLPLRDKPALIGPEPADVEAWAKRAEDESYGVAVARTGAEIARVATQSARNGHAPTLDLSATVQQQRASGSTTLAGDDSTRTAVVGLQLTVPIYSGGIIQSRVREALANEQRAAQDLESARRNAGQGARQAYTGVDFGLAQVRALESAEVSSHSQLDSTRLGFQVGVRINLDVLNAVSQLFNTQRDLKKARYDFLVNGLKLKAAAGAATDQDVELISNLLQR